MIDFLLAVLQGFWAIMKEASVYLLVGFLLAGVLAVLVRWSGNGRGPRFRYRSTEAVARWPSTAMRLSATFLGHGSTSWTRVFTSCAFPALSVNVSALWVYS